MGYTSLDTWIDRGTVIDCHVQDDNLLRVIDMVLSRIGEGYMRDFPAFYIFDINCDTDLPFILRLDVFFSSRAMKSHSDEVRIGCVAITVALVMWTNVEYERPEGLDDVFEIARLWGFAQEVAAAQKVIDFNPDLMVLER